jgi:hypothetical protein
MKVVHLNREQKSDLATELKKIIAAKWDKRDRLQAEKEYADPGKRQIKSREEIRNSHTKTNA